MRHTFLLAALPFTLVACQQQAAPGPEASDVAADTASSETQAPVATGAATPTPSPTDTSGIPEGGIPVALQGNWGMVPADCTSTRGDNKGLLRITATTLQFYESLGRLGTIKSHSDNAIRANFAFTGEGMTWTRDEELSVSGTKLTRTERGGDEPGGPFTYTKCAA